MPRVGGAPLCRRAFPVIRCAQRVLPLASSKCAAIGSRRAWGRASATARGAASHRDGGSDGAPRKGVRRVKPHCTPRHGRGSDRHPTIRHRDGAARGPDGACCGRARRGPGHSPRHAARAARQGRPGPLRVTPKPCRAIIGESTAASSYLSPRAAGPPAAKPAVRLPAEGGFRPPPRGRREVVRPPPCGARRAEGHGAWRHATVRQAPRDAPRKAACAA
jgi:hypothetical protein